jgi:hypothetical protein
MRSEISAPSSKKNEHNEGKRHSHHTKEDGRSITLRTGPTNASQSDDDINYIFAGTSPATAPSLQFIGRDFVSGGSIPYSVDSLSTNGPGVGVLPSAYGFLKVGTSGQFLGNQTIASVQVTDGLHLNRGILDTFINFNSKLTVSGSSTIENGSALHMDTPRASGTFDLNGTLTLGALGANNLTTGIVPLGGNGIVRQLGENDKTTIGWSVSNGVKFDIQGGVLELRDVGGFDGTIGPSTSAGKAIGLFGEVDLFTEASRADFDLSTGLLSLVNAAGEITGKLHLSGDAHAIRLDKVTPPSGGSYLALHDQGVSQGNVPITFH